MIDLNHENFLMKCYNYILEIVPLYFKLNSIILLNFRNDLDEEIKETEQSDDDERSCEVIYQGFKGLLNC